MVTPSFGNSVGNLTAGRSENWDISGRHLAMHRRSLKIVYIYIYIYTLTQQFPRTYPKQ